MIILELSENKKPRLNNRGYFGSGPIHSIGMVKSLNTKIQYFNDISKYLKQ